MINMKRETCKGGHRRARGANNAGMRRTWVAAIGVLAASVLVMSPGIRGEQDAPTTQLALEDGKGAYATGKYRNLFVEAGYSPEEVKAKINHAYEQLFHGDPETELLFFPSGENENGPLAYIPDIQHTDVRSEGMSYGGVIPLVCIYKVNYD